MPATRLLVDRLLTYTLAFGALYLPAIRLVDMEFGCSSSYFNPAHLNPAQGRTLGEEVL